MAVSGVATVGVRPAAAATGDQVGTVTFSQACSSGIGVGITYDGSSLWYSCYAQSPDLFRANPTTGQVTGSWNIAGGLGALAYDSSRNAIWAAWAGSTDGNIWLVNLDATHSVTSSSVAFSTCSTYCSISIDDGLAYDAADDSLYVSPDTSTTVYHYDTKGNVLGQFAWAGNSCYNSGLGLGGADLYEGSDGCNQVWVVAKSNPSQVLFSFATGGVRDESLTCDPNTFASQGDTVMWSKEAYSAVAYAFQIPSGSCGSGGTSSGPPVGGAIGGTEQTSGNPNENSVQCQGGGHPINCATGDFWHTFNDLSIPGRGLPLSLDRTYNSALAGTNGPFGAGWSSTYNMSLSTDASGNVTVHQENGSTNVFNPNGSGGYTAPPRVLATLVKNADGSYTLTRRQRQKFTFSSSGQLISESDLSGYTTTLGYNAAGQLASVTDPAGRALTFVYGANGLVASVADPANRTVTYAYDLNGNLTDVIDVGGGHWQFTYDAGHRMLTMREPRFYGDVTTTPSPVITNTYDSAGRVVSQSDQLGRTTTYDYTSIPGSTKITDPNGNVTVEGYSYGELTSITKGYGTAQAATWSFSYDANTIGQTVSTDPDGHTTVRSFDANGNLTSVEDPLHRKSAATYDSLDDLTAYTDPAGVTTSNTYDPAGNLLGTSTPLVGSNPAQARTSSYAYGDAAHPGDVTAVTDPDGKVWSYAYDTYGDNASVTDPLGDKTTYTYDTVGRPTASVSPKGNVTGGSPSSYTTAYVTNAYGDLTQVTDPLGHVTKVGYDANRNRTSVTDADNKTTTYTYDPANQQTGTTQANNTSLSYSHDGDGNLTVQKDAKGDTTSYAYDPLNRVASVTDPLNRSTSYTYDGAGNTLTMVDPAAQTTSYAYDAANEASGITYSDAKTPNVTGIVYDPDGRRTSMTDGTGTSTWAYDSLGRLTSNTNGAGSTVSYGYDLKGQLTSIAYPGSTGTVTRAYDAAGNLTSVTDWAGHTTTFGYDPDTNATAETFPTGTGITDSFVYNAADQLTGITDAKAGATFASFAYTRDGNAQETSVASSGMPADNHSYTYDPLNRLTGVDSATYGYDAANNLTKLTSGATQSFDAASQLTNPGYTYDSRGNRTAGPAALGGSASYAYDQANRLSSYTATQAAGQNAASLIGGGEGHTVALRSDGTVWSWGENNDGQLGNNTTANSSVPVQTSTLTGVTAVAAGGYHSLAVAAGGAVWAWGYNVNGQLGNNSTVNSSVPVQVSGLTGATAVCGGTYHSLALKSDGSVWGWGYNHYGQLGNNSTTTSLVPVQVSGLSGVSAVACGGEHSLALKSDGTVWAWGNNHDGELGNNSTRNSSVPVQVSGLTGATAIAGGGSHSLAVKSGGSAWAWGNNVYGQLGNNSTTNALTPTQVSGLTGVTGLKGGDYHSLALKSDGTVWAWGFNGNGQLGNNTTTNSLVPVQASGITSVSSIAAGGSHSLALKSDGTVWAWGYNAYGQLGNNSTTNSLAPVQSSITGVGTTSTTTTYAYNGVGLRMSKTTNGTTEAFIWDQAEGAVPLLLVDGSTDYVYGRGGLPLEQVSATGTLFYHDDQLGSTRVVTDVSGNIVATYTYDAYGNASAVTGTITNPLRYAGQYTDAESGLVYLRARYYDPSTGQFLSVDPLVGTTQARYKYATDNPVNGADPSGLYSYTYSEDVGAVSQIGSAAEVMTVFQQNLNQVFPFPISGGCEIADGAVCTLHPEPWWMEGQGTVQVGDVSATSFAFTVLDQSTAPLGLGYFDPPGSQITFSTYEAIGSGGSCDVFLQQHGDAPGATWYVNPIAPILAKATWNQQAQNLFNVAFLAMHPSADPWTYGQSPQPGSTPPAYYPT